MPLASLAHAQAKVADLPSDGGKTVDTLAGAQLRTFIRLNELEAALIRVTHRLSVLEGNGDHEPIVDRRNGSRP
jgi:hypothetical protein